MLSLSLKQRPLRVLCLGAHSDDIEIGCAGTLSKLAEEPDGVHVHWVVLGADSRQRASEARASAAALLKVFRDKKITVKGFRDGYFPFHGTAIKEHLETLKKTRPDVIFTHYRKDLHQDHRVVAEFTWQTFRDHWILEYEVPKYDGDLGSPNFFVGLDEPAVQLKAKHILNHFSSQGERAWFTEETFRALARIRGVESRASGSYAEAFYCQKVLWQP